MSTYPGLPNWICAVIMILAAIHVTHMSRKPIDYTSRVPSQEMIDARNIAEDNLERLLGE